MYVAWFGSRDDGEGRRFGWSLPNEDIRKWDRGQAELLAGREVFLIPDMDTYQEMRQWLDPRR